MSETRIVFSRRAKFMAENEVLIRHFEILNKILFDAKNSYELWWGYLKTKSEKKYFNVFLKYKEFFETIGASCITSIVVNLFKLYDESQESYSMLHLINDVNRRNLLTVSERRNIRITKKKAIIIWEKVSKLRHKLFAHRVRDLTIGEIYALAHVKPNDFRNLTKYTLEILNCVAPKIYKAKKRFHRAVRKDSLTLLRTLMNSC